MRLLCTVLSGVLFSTALSTHATAAVLGRFDHVRNLPGYLNLNDKNSVTYDIEKVISINSGSNKDGIDSRSPSKILREDYMNKDGSVKIEKIHETADQLMNYLSNAFITYCADKEKELPLHKCASYFGDENLEIYQKWKERKLAVAAEFAFDEFNRAIKNAAGLNLKDTNTLNSSAAVSFIEPLFQALEVTAAIYGPVNDYKASLGQTLSDHLNIITKKITIDPGPEATNLIPPSPLNDELYYAHPNQLLGLGVDISKLDPYDSGFWRKPEVPISEFDMKNYNNLLQAGFPEDDYDKIKDIENPHIPIDVTFDSPASGGKTPKLDVQFKGYKVKMKIDVPRGVIPGQRSLRDLLGVTNTAGAEVRAEYIANSLAAALGFTVDPTFYKKTVRLFLDDKFDPNLVGNPEGETELAEKFAKAKRKMLRKISDSDSPIRSGSATRPLEWEAGFTDIHRVESGDQKGRYYIKMNSVSLEFRRIEGFDWKTGHYSKVSFGRPLKREYRAFQIFYSWLTDRDARDENASVGIVDVNPALADGANKKTYFSASDMGATLGNVLIKNAPNFFNYDLLDMEKVDFSLPPNERTLTFKDRQIFISPLHDAVTIADAQWIARMMAQLTEQQFMDAFETANYPKVVAEVYTQKLLRRRDQLISALGLEGEIYRSPKTGRTIQISSRTSKVREPKSYAAPSCRECFKDGLLLDLPDGDYDYNWTRTFGDPNATGEPSFLQVIPSALKAIGAEKIGRRMQRFGVASGLEFHGVSLGLDTFLPARFIVNNPLEDSDKKYWIVDVFRIGVNQRYEEALGEIGFFPNDNRFRGMAGATEVFELIKVRPVETSDVFGLKDILSLYDPRNMVAGPIKGISERMLKDMAEGDFLISSRYLTLGAGAKSSVTGLLSPGFGMEAAVFTTVTDRVLVHRENENSALMSWADISAYGAKAGLYFDWVLLTQPLLKARVDKLKSTNRTYRVNIASPEGKQKVANNIGRDIPGSELEPHAVSTSEINSTLKEFAISFFGLASWNWYSEGKSYTLADRDKEILQSYYRHRRGKTKSSKGLSSFVTSKGTDSVSLVDRVDKTVVAKIDLSYTRSYARRDDYAKMVKQFKGLIPPQMVMFDNESVNYYLGPLNVAGTVILSHQAINDMLAPNSTFGEKTDAHICGHYAQYTKVLYAGYESQSESQRINTFCREVSSVLDANKYARRLTSDPVRANDIREIIVGAKNFVRRYKKARSSYEKFINATTNRDIEKHAKDLTERMTALLQSTPRQGAAHMALLSMTEKSNIFREVEIVSGLNSFPGQRGSLTLNERLQGDDDLKSTFFAEGDDAQMRISRTVDPVMQVLNPFFYSFYWKEGLQKTSHSYDPVGL